LNERQTEHTKEFLVHPDRGVPIARDCRRFDRLASRHVLEAKGISYPEFLVVMAVRELFQPTHGEVGKLLDMSKSLVSQRVGALLAKGFIVQRRDPKNCRQVRLTLTKSGQQALGGIYKQLRPVPRGFSTFSGRSAIHSCNRFDVFGMC
jgi:DNA-binding MarR family transcriptional regulator